MTYVLDASALLAYLHREPGWEIVQPVIAESCISTVNWCEVAQKAEQNGMIASSVRGLLEELGLVFTPLNTEQAELAAHLWKQGKKYGLSLADRACLALGQTSDCAVITADRVWAELKLDVDIQLLR